MRTETWYYCDRHCGYKTQDKDEMEQHDVIERVRRDIKWINERAATRGQEKSYGK
jgi:hypothetical protein